MSDFMEILKTRRSIRHYKEDQVPEESLNRVLEAVQWSPSWANTQCWEIVVAKDPRAKEQLAESIPTGNPGKKAVTGAPLVLALCGKLNESGYYKGNVTTKFGDWFLFDLGIASQSICLAAQSQGLGTVILGLFDHDKAKAALDIPEGYELCVLIPMGVAAKDSKAPKRKDISSFTHEDVFKSKDKA